LFLASDYPFLDVLWTMLVFFGFVIWLWLLFTVVGDLFRRHDVSGWGKAGWIIVLVFLPYLGVLIYMIANAKGMAERSAQAARAQQSQLDDYVRSVADSGGAAGEIERAKKLLDSGAINQAEFDAIKQKALSSG
jgi:hypothetical protein